MVTTKSELEHRLSIIKALNGVVMDTTLFRDAGFWQSAMREGILAVLWQRLSGVKMPDEARRLVTPDLRAHTAEIMYMRKASAEVLAAAHSLGIPVICLRGQALAESLYENPAARPQSDVDVLIGSADVPEFTAALQTLGFTPTPLYPMVFERGQVLVDAHTDIIGIARIASRAHATSLRSGEFFRHSKQGELCGQPALLLEERVLMPYLCLHALKHSFGRLIWLWDIALLARRIDEAQAWAEVADGIRAYRLERPCYYALSYVQRHLDAPVPRSVIQSIRPAMGWREARLFERFMAHETVPYMAERLFARMMPDMNTRLAFWRETVFPRREVREQFPDTAGRNFIRDRLRRLLGMFLLIWREILALFRLPT